MYITAIAQATITPDTPPNVPVLSEHGVSLMETLSLLGNSMLDHLDVPDWNISVHIDMS